MVAASTGFTGPAYYDSCLGPAWFDPFAADLVRRLPPRPPGDVLEIACGTGLVTRRLRQRLDPAVRLVATDLSADMLGYAKAKLEPIAGIEWQTADAMRLPFAGPAFGAVVCGFGVMFAPDPLAMLQEARRVLVAGGILLFNVWDRIEENPHAATNARVLENLFPGDPEMRFRVPYSLHDPERLRRLVTDAGFGAADIEVVRLPIAGADPHTIATGQIRGTPRSALIAARGLALPGVIEQVAAALAKDGGSPYHGYAQALVVQAVARTR